MSNFLLVWNPNRWHWNENDLEQAILSVQNGELVSRRWSCGRTRKIKRGDRVFLIRLGKEPKGIFGSGIVTKEPYEAPHWAEVGKNALFIKFNYLSLVNPEQGNVIAPRDFLKNDPRFSLMHWDSQMSGVQIPDDIADELGRVWNEIIGDFSFPEEVTEDVLYEGARRRISVNAYERNPVARRKCIEHFGTRCIICGFDFEEVYGDIGQGFIHVHHLKSIADIGETYEVDPINDMRPVCPNCHAMIHRRSPAYSLEEVRDFLGADSKG